MSNKTSVLLSQTVNDLKQVLNSSLGASAQHADTIGQIEQIVASIEHKLNNIDFAAESTIVEANSGIQFTQV